LSDFRQSAGLAWATDFSFPCIFNISFCTVVFDILHFLRSEQCVSYGRSKRVIKIDGSDRSNFWEGRDVEISISSKKIMIMLSENYSKRLAVYIRNRNVFVFFYIHGLSVFASTCQIFVRHLAQVGWPISRSLVSDVCADLIHLT
jgi:hypothetical protein